MGRNTHPNRGPRTDLRSDREIRRALRGDRPAAFGIRRLLERDSEDDILDVTFGMQGEGDLPRNVVLRDRLAVTLLSQKVISRQMARGVVIGYQLGRTGALIERSDGCSERDESLTVALGDVRVFKDRVVYASVESAKIKEEINSIHAILGSIGIRGLAKTEKPYVPHVTLGTSEKGHAMSRTEQRHVVHMLEEELPMQLTVEGWDIYPDNVFDQRRS